VVAVAAVLVLAGLGMFVLGITTGVAAWSWGCLAACVVAGVLVLLARRRTPDPAPATPAADRPAPRPTAGAPTASEPPAPAIADDGPGPAARVRPGEAPDPPEEDVEVTDLLLVVDLTDEVHVADGHPRYHLADCRATAGRETVALPVRRARADGFTPCAACSPDAALAGVERARRASRRG
jgi:hypothetical protein